MLLVVAAQGGVQLCSAQQGPRFNDGAFASRDWRALGARVLLRAQLLIFLLQLSAGGLTGAQEVNATAAILCAPGEKTLKLFELDSMAMSVLLAKSNCHTDEWDECYEG